MKKKVKQTVTWAQNSAFGLLFGIAVVISSLRRNRNPPKTQ